VNYVTQIPPGTNPFADLHRWTVRDCEILEAAGALIPGEYELLDGQVVKKLGQNGPHMNANFNVILALTLIFGSDYVIIPISVAVNPENRPEPDAGVINQRRQNYNTGGNPQPADMRLVVEVADTTLWRDLNVKTVIYGRAGVPDYWVLDVNNRKLHVHRQPTSDGYDDVQEYNETQSVAPLAAPNSPIAVLDLLP
jgi:Uma2 family endonuclease